MVASQIEILASKITSENNITKATGGVVLLNDGNHIRAEELIMCSDTNESELFGNVFISQPNSDLSLTNYLFIKDGKTKIAYADQLYTHFSETGLWIAGSEAQMEGNITHLQKGSVSGCKPSSPDWSIRFSSAKVDQEKEWVDMYNPTFYAGRVPVFYLPYFGHYTTKKRRSGLLIPSVGQSSKEGFLYQQPIYYAPYDQVDLELLPQIRADRGSGITGVFRFVDSPYSKGTITYGEFSDKSKFIEKEEVAVPDHWGKRFDYKRTRLFTKPKSSSQEGVVISYQDYSDVEFVELEKIEQKAETQDISALITNKADYFYKNDNIYLGLYTREFKNIQNRKQNKTIVQITPEAHGHIFNRSLFLDNLLFSVDARGKNYTRDEGLEAKDATITAPVSYSFLLFDDYLLASMNYQASYYQISYDDNRYKTGKEASQKLGFGLSTLLARPYENFFHTIGFGADYLDPFSKTVEGNFVSDFVTKDETESTEYATTAFKLSQYFYDNSGRSFLTHRLNQAMLMDENDTLLDLENELVFSPIANYTLTNTTKYSHDFDAVVSTSTSFAKSGDFKYSLSHLYENKTGKEVTKRYVSIAAGYKIDGRHRVDGEWQRDLLASEDRGWRVAYTYNKKCWQSELSFARRISPYTTASGTTDSRINDVVFLKLTLVPFGDLNQQLYEKERR